MRRTQRAKCFMLGKSRGWIIILVSRGNDHCRLHSNFGQDSGGHHLGCLRFLSSCRPGHCLMGGSKGTKSFQFSAAAAGGTRFSPTTTTATTLPSRRSTATVESVYRRVASRTRRRPPPQRSAGTTDCTCFTPPHSRQKSHRARTNATATTIYRDYYHGRMIGTRLNLYRRPPLSGVKLSAIMGARKTGQS